MNNKEKVALVLAIVPLLLLTMSGMTLSHWDDDVKVEGSISMGTFDIQMSLEGTYDNEDSLDVGHTSAMLANWDDGDDMNGGVNDALQITMDNVYPGYEGCILFNMHNTGTIPANTSEDMITLTSSSTFDWDTYGEYVTAELYYMAESTPILLAHLENGEIVYDYDFTTDTLGILTLNVDESQWYQLCIGLTQDPNAPEAMMDTSMEFSLVLTWIQAVP